MKKFIVGAIFGCLLMSTTLVSGSSSKTIQVIFGQIKLVIDGKTVDKETLLYNGTTYVPLRAVAEIFNKDVSYDDYTKTVYIGKNDSMPNLDIQNESKLTSNDKYYKSFPTVPDFGDFFGIDMIENMYYGEYQFVYLMSDLPNGIESVKEYLNLLRNYKFIVAEDVPSLSGNDVTLKKDKVYVTIAVVDNEVYIFIAETD